MLTLIIIYHRGQSDKDERDIRIKSSPEFRGQSDDKSNFKVGNDSTQG